MIALLVTGPNCSGKSTTVDLALLPWRGDPRVKVVHADAEGAWKGKPAELQTKVRELWNSSIPVIVFEGTNRLASNVGAAERALSRQGVVFVTTQESEVMEAHLRTRCAKRGKTFREDYWTTRVLQYEGQRRYRTIAAQYFPEARFFPIGLAYEGQQALVVAIATAVVEGLR